MTKWKVSALLSLVLMFTLMGSFGAPANAGGTSHMPDELDDAYPHVDIIRADASWTRENYYKDTFVSQVVMRSRGDFDITRIR